MSYDGMNYSYCKKHPHLVIQGDECNDYMARDQDVNAPPTPKFRLDQKVYLIERNYGSKLYNVKEDRIQKISIVGYVYDEKNHWNVQYRVRTDGEEFRYVEDNYAYRSKTEKHIRFYNNEKEALLYCKTENDRIKTEHETLIQSDEIEDKLNDEIGFRNPDNCYDDCKYCDSEDYEYVCNKHRFIICDPMKWICDDCSKS